MICKLSAAGGALTITIKERLQLLRHIETMNELQQARLEFKESCNRRWRLARPGWKTPWQSRHGIPAGKMAA